MEGLETVAVVLEITEVSAIEKCTRQHVLNASKNAKFRSNLQKANQSTARNVSEIKNHEGFRLNS